jgi:protein TonB
MKTSLTLLLCLAAFVAAPRLRAADIEPPVPVRTVPPEFPKAMRAAGTSGIVVVSCQIDDKGSVASATVAKSTNPAFDQAALDAVEKWKFRPASKDGKPVAIQVQFPVKFTVDD